MCDGYLNIMTVQAHSHWLKNRNLPIPAVASQVIQGRDISSLMTSITVRKWRGSFQLGKQLPTFYFSGRAIE